MDSHFSAIADTDQGILEKYTSYKEMDHELTKRRAALAALIATELDVQCEDNYSLELHEDYVTFTYTLYEVTPGCAFEDDIELPVTVFLGDSEHWVAYVREQLQNSAVCKAREKQYKQVQAAIDLLRAYDMDISVATERRILLQASGKN
jgi:hypothetical protein